ncbi:MAG TPA: signal peptidase I [Acidimicrobiales bacterium]|nr:signal peptidase I [Acidimicrobiales bacterium]
MAPRPTRSQHWHRSIRRALTGLLALVVSAGIVVILLTNHAYVSTPSMYPTIPPGSMVFIEAQHTYHVGQVIEFKGNGLLWVHRLVKIEPNGDLVTKGDNPQSTPDVFVPPTTMRDVVGTIVVSVPYLGFPELIAHDPSYGLSWLRAELGITGKLVVLALAAVVCALLITRMRRSVDPDPEDDHADLADIVPSIPNGDA